LRIVWSVIGNSNPDSEIKRIATLVDIDSHAMERPVREAYDLAKSLSIGLDYRLESHGLGGLAFAKTLQAALVEIERDCLVFHRDDLARDPAGFSLELRAFLAFGEKVSDADIATARVLLDDARQRIMAIFTVCDAILMPTTPCVPFSFNKTMPNDIAHFTILASIAGLPAISLPCGWSDEGLPIGVQLVGRPGSENALLDMAQRLDSAAGGYVFPEFFNDEGS
jgi:aspartyl-tRNA(Asn)/glutamyl-tRNA(Gln) amidotransferase subunit A